MQLKIIPLPLFSILLYTLLSLFTLLNFLNTPLSMAEEKAAETQLTQLIHRSENTNPNAAYQWLQILLETSGRDVDRSGARPTVLSRTMAIVLTSMYDAWAAYDEKAIGTQLGGKLRRPARERTLKNKETAIAYAAYRSLLDVYPTDHDWIKERMKAMGYDPDNHSKNIRTAIGIGNVAAEHVVNFRHHDGANQLGDEVGTIKGPYSDYTFYRPKNTLENIVDPLTWFPIPFYSKDKGTFSPGFLTPHWYRVKPFAMKDAHQFLPPPPPLYGSEQLKKEVEEAIAVNASLTLEQKAIVEFMRDGPRSTGQSGHWLQFAQDVSRRDKNTLDQDIKLFFSIGNVVFDAFIACWDAKRFYDTSRPYWWVRIYKKDEKILGWAGPGQGVTKIPAEKWHPYSPDSFVTPPFPGYVSGHATASAAASKILELFTKSDQFRAVEIRTAGQLTEAEFSPSQMQALEGKSGKDLPASKEIRLELPTFSAVAEMAAVSRLWGGYHILTDNDEGLVLGRKVAAYSWPIYQGYFEGKIQEKIEGKSQRSLAMKP